MNAFDVIVVGGGPAGAAVARAIVQDGFRVVILERDTRIGSPVQCSGLITERTLDAAGLSPAIAMNAVTGAAIHAPSGTRYAIGGDRIHAYVMDRSHFDHQVMASARDAGVELRTGAQVVGIERDANGVQVTVARNRDQEIYHARLIIGADGPRSLVASFLNLPPPSELLRARGADVRLPHCATDDQVQIFVGERYAPGFFAWAIPLGGDQFRIGWGSSRPSPIAGSLSALMRDYPQIFAGMRIESQTGGLIPLGPRPTTIGDGGMVVGDAAGQAKATSGGGLYTSLVCAGHCARTAVAALRVNDVSARTLVKYDHDWRSDIGVELERASALRVAYRGLSDSEIEWGLRLLRVPGVRAMVDRFGDIDYPSTLATVALRAYPRISRLLKGNRDIPELLDVDLASVVAGDA